MGAFSACRKSDEVSDTGNRVPVPNSPRFSKLGSCWLCESGKDALFCIDVARERLVTLGRRFV